MEQLQRRTAELEQNQKTFQSNYSSFNDVIKNVNSLILQRRHSLTNRNSITETPTRDFSVDDLPAFRSSSATLELSNENNKHRMSIISNATNDSINEGISGHMIGLLNECLVLDENDHSPNEVSATTDDQTQQDRQEGLSSSSPSSHPHRHRRSLSKPVLPKSPYLDEDLLPLGSKSSLFDSTIDSLLEVIGPTEQQLAHRLSMISLLRRCIRHCLGGSCFEVGLSSSRCFLPDDPVRLMVTLPKSMIASWHTSLCDYLTSFAEKVNAYSGSLFIPYDDDDSLDPYFLSSLLPSSAMKNHFLGNISHMKVNSNHIVQLIIDSIPVEIVVNSRLDLVMLSFFEEVSLLIDENAANNAMINNDTSVSTGGIVPAISLPSEHSSDVVDDTPPPSLSSPSLHDGPSSPIVSTSTTSPSFLFKKSYLLIRAWWCYETPSFVGCIIRHYLSDYQLFVMILSIFNQYSSFITTPFQALCLFLAEYSTYDGNSQAITLNGITSFLTRASNSPVLLDEQPYHLFKNDLLEKYWTIYNITYIQEQESLSSQNGGSSSNHHRHRNKQRSSSSEDPVNNVMPTTAGSSSTLPGGVAASAETILPVDNSMNNGVDSGNTSADISPASQGGIVVEGNENSGKTDTNTTTILGEISDEITFENEKVLILESLKTLSSSNLQFFDRSSFNIVNPLNHTNMITEKLSQRRISRLSRAFQIGATNLAFFLKRTIEEGGLNCVTSPNPNNLPSPSVMNNGNNSNEFNEGIKSYFPNINSYPNPWTKQFKDGSTLIDVL
jgi:hypothetical protein